MVNDHRKHDGATFFLCEFCGFGYGDIDTAEDCEQYCGTRGIVSADIRRRAVHVPRVQVVPMQ